MQSHVRPPAAKGPQIPIPDAAASWFLNAARQLGLADPQARDFARSGELPLPGLTLQLVQWQQQPVAQWLALGWLQRPLDCTPALWSELLLRANCATSAMSTCAGALDDHGNAVLVSRLQYQPYSDTRYLAAELSHLLALGESLIAGATALSSPLATSNAAAGPPPVASPAARAQAQAAMAQTWHRPLLEQVLRHLGIAPPLAAPETVGVIRLNGRALEIIADSDQRHLLVSTAIDAPLHGSDQRELALRANLQLMTLTGCAIALAPQGACLQARWDSQGLDAQALVDWLLDFAAFAESFATPSAPETTPTRTQLRNPTWS
ncbi:type III secretion system chaperone [Pseudomonas gingeri]|uniref:type III secretion system chaperone n=3 Tax=Pseudomonas gingeri TaxID=117681 RepID=UPI00159FFE0E|nr:type III secretion system chaperone [Pseudomonas gingeri]NVZ62670.1 type III secretion system chaperone [Pseudomonas gingeri]NWE73397.1 type III secretion system chaperone [Pseudomonas gingeri]